MKKIISFLLASCLCIQSLSAIPLSESSQADHSSVEYIEKPKNLKERFILLAKGVGLGTLSLASAGGICWFIKRIYDYSYRDLPETYRNAFEGGQDPAILKRNLDTLIREEPYYKVVNFAIFSTLIAITLYANYKHSLPANSLKLCKQALS